MKKKKFLIIPLVMLMVVSFLFLTAGGSKEEKGGAAPAAEQKVEKKAEKKPVTLTILTMTGPWISGPVKQHAPDWEKKTGNKINVVEAAFSDIFPKIQQAAATHSAAFDILLVSNIWMGDMVGWKYVIPLDNYIKDPEVQYDADVPDGIKKKNTFAGHTYGLICDNDNMYLFYRKDILGNKDYQAKFKEKYGYNYHVPPQTIDELIDVAEFFNGWDWDNDGEVEYGFVRSTKRGAQTYWYSFPWIAPYIVMPADKAGAPGVMFFEPDNMDPLVNTPGWEKGIEKFVDMGKRGCAPGLDWVRADVINEMILGHAAMAIDWGDIGPNSHSEKSLVKGKIGYAMPPGTHEYWDWKDNKWVHTDDVHYAPVHCYNGWSWYITSTCKYPDVAWDFIKYMISPEISSYDVANPFSGFQPWRKSHLTNLDMWVKFGWSKEEAREYVQNTLNVTNDPNAVIDLRIPGAADYEENIYETILTEVLAGQKTVKQAMDECAKQWNDLTDRLGRDKQLKFYREHLNLR